MSLTAKFTLFTSLLCVVIVSGVTISSYLISKKELAMSIGERLEAIVSSAAPFLDGDLHDTIQTKEDADGEAFINLKNQLRQLKNANNLKQEVYTFRLEGQIMKYVVMTHDKPFIGDTYSVRPEMEPTLRQGKPTHTHIYEDDHGTWISAYAPIRDSNGNLSGILEADVDVSFYQVKLKRKFEELVGFGAIVGIVAVLLSFLLAKTVTRKLNYLTDITEKISLGNMEKAIEIKGSDEVAKLGASLERMRESLKIAADMID